MKWRRRFWTGEVICETRKLVPEWHGAEGLLHYFRDGEHFRLWLCRGALKGDPPWWIGATDVDKVVADGKFEPISDELRETIVAEVNQAHRDVWHQDIGILPPFDPSQYPITQ